MNAPLASGPLVEVSNLWKAFGSEMVLRGIDLTVERGEVVSLLGPSGSGKSTLLRCINGLEPINGGRLSVDGKLIGYDERNGRLHDLTARELARQRRGIGMVFQSFNLFPHLTALENVTLAPRLVLGESKAQARERRSLS